MEVLLLAFVVILCSFIYFVPTIIAYCRGHRNTLAIFLFNLFFGWSLLGWIIALIWAVYKECKQ